ncbi:hypothetical protein VTJ49DRAFT_3415 [Mycothermus thermophilus]|uniref:CFEM domain-containing protein n=1 Tax=Humicola insolens TaxID=85995 RepID=A0ABR3V7K7_HUMIN
MMPTTVFGLLILALVASIASAVPASAPAALLIAAALKGMPSCAHLPVTILLARPSDVGCEATDVVCLCGSGALLKAAQHRVAAACLNPADVLAAHQWVTARCVDALSAAPPGPAAAAAAAANSAFTSPAAPSRPLLLRLQQGRHNPWILRLYSIVFAFTVLWNAGMDQDHFLRTLLRELRRFRDMMFFCSDQARLRGAFARARLDIARRRVRGLWQNHWVAWSEYQSLRMFLSGMPVWPPPLGSLLELEYRWLRVVRSHRRFVAANRERARARQRFQAVAARCRVEQEEIQEAFEIMIEGVNDMIEELWPRITEPDDQSDDDETLVGEDDDEIQAWEHDDDETLVVDDEDEGQEGQDDGWEDLGEDVDGSESTWEDDDEWEDLGVDHDDRE